ncbi:MAG: TM2 domain-containing protein [Ruminococcaceae bacterium]|nr:TM2 domain-containing protein [Oscillospiraceae bacterium]
MTYPVKNKMLAVILAFFLGSVGVHKFYLGQKLQGILYIAFVWTYIPILLALIDAILMLTMTDETFKQKFKCRLS